MKIFTLGKYGEWGIHNPEFEDEGWGIVTTNFNSVNTWGREFGPNVNVLFGRENMSSFFIIILKYIYIDMNSIKECSINNFNYIVYFFENK